MMLRVESLQNPACVFTAQVQHDLSSIKFAYIAQHVSKTKEASLVFAFSKAVLFKQISHIH